MPLPAGWPCAVTPAVHLIRCPPHPPRLVPAAATAGVPLLAGTLPGLFLSRALVGLGEGVAPSAATDLVARRCALSPPAPAWRPQ